jgi:hypothetical protein
MPEQSLPDSERGFGNLLLPRQLTIELHSAGRNFLFC